MKIQSKSIRLIARILGLIGCLLAIVFIITFSYQAAEENKQWANINYLLIFLIFGYIIAWFRAREGGLILTFGSIIMYLYYSYLPKNNEMNLWVYLLGFLISGLLFLGFDYFRQRE